MEKHDGIGLYVVSFGHRLADGSDHLLCVGLLMGIHLLDHHESLLTIHIDGERPAHSRAYIAYCLAHLRAGLEKFNRILSRKSAGRGRRVPRRPQG